MVLTTISLLLSGPVWPSAPVPDAFDAGQKLAQERHGANRVGATYRQPAGLWFDGIAKRHSQWAWLLTPECASEWLGFTAGRELRAPEESLCVWRTWTKAHQGEMVAVVLLTAFPKLAPVSKDVQKRADRWDLTDLRASLALDGSACPLIEATLRERLAGEGPGIAEGYPFGEAAGLRFATPSRPSLNPNVVPVGSYYAAAWVLRFDVRKAPAEWRQATLSLVSRGIRTDVTFPNPAPTPSVPPQLAVEGTG
jgi:hypothetical protein